MADEMDGVCYGKMWGSRSEEMEAADATALAMGLDERVGKLQTQLAEAIALLREGSYAGEAECIEYCYTDWDRKVFVFLAKQGASR